MERDKKEADMIGRGVREVVGCNRVSVTAIRFLDEFLSCCAHTLDINPSDNAKRACGVDARTSVGEGNDRRDVFTDGPIHRNTANPRIIFRRLNIELFGWRREKHLAEIATRVLLALSPVLRLESHGQYKSELRLQ